MKRVFTLTVLFDVTKDMLGSLKLIALICFVFLNTGCGSYLGKYLKNNGYVELRPPSTIYKPGSIVAFVPNGNNPNLVLICEPEGAVGSVNILTSNSSESDFAKKITRKFKLKGNYLNSINGELGGEYVKEIMFRLSNVKIQVLAKEQLYKDSKVYPSLPCTLAFNAEIEDGRSVGYILSVIEADVKYRVNYTKAVTADIKELIIPKLSAALSVELGTSGSKGYEGKSLYWGFTYEDRILAKKRVFGSGWQASIEMLGVIESVSSEEKRKKWTGPFLVIGQPATVSQFEPRRNTPTLQKDLKD